MTMTKCTYDESTSYIRSTEIDQISHDRLRSKKAEDDGLSSEGKPHRE